MTVVAVRRCGGMKMCGGGSSNNTMTYIEFAVEICLFDDDRSDFTGQIRVIAHGLHRLQNRQEVFELLCRHAICAHHTHTSKSELEGATQGQRHAWDIPGWTRIFLMFAAISFCISGFLSIAALAVANCTQARSRHAGQE
jgi:hypothetical protein